MKVVYAVAFDTIYVALAVRQNFVWWFFTGCSKEYTIKSKKSWRLLEIHVLQYWCHSGFVLKFQPQFMRLFFHYCLSDVHLGNDLQDLHLFISLCGTYSDTVVML